jgi:hypothetical protein
VFAEDGLRDYAACDPAFVLLVIGLSSPSKEKGRGDNAHIVSKEDDSLRASDAIRLHREQSTHPVDNEHEPVHADVLQPASVDSFAGLHLVFRAGKYCLVFKIFLRLRVRGFISPIIQAPKI